MTRASEAEQTVFGLTLVTVSQLNERVRACLEDRFGLVAVAGEIADLAFPRSGHVYFSLCDAQGKLSGVMWRGLAQRLPFQLKDGMQVIVVGRLTLYAARGTYQIVTSELIPRGVGEIRRAFEELKRRLAAEGLFSEERKKPLPFLPLSIAVVTSPTGAAIHDILRTALSRFPRLTVRVFPALVQGRGAPDEIVRALDLANQPGVADVIFLGRGGGGLEDLWAFNAEQVVRAIAASRVPVISCVGHETDVTLSDLAADVRASTPTQAAAIAIPVLADLEARLDERLDRALRSLTHAVSGRRAALDLLAARPPLAQPDRRIRDLAQQLDDVYLRMAGGVCTSGRDLYNQLFLVKARLDSLDPRAALRRGYTMTRALSGALLRSIGSVRAGDAIEVLFADGVARARVEDVREEDLGRSVG